MGAQATIGAYKVLKKIGEGGMGAVYIGEHSLLGRKAAIKVLLPSLSANEAIVRRFFNEARAVTRISDPGIVQVFDFGQDGDGSAFIVMELLEGESMSRRLARAGPFGVTDAVRLIRMTCTSLAAAHAKGIVHRDLKPDNIFIVGDPAVTGGERPKILDFGIAKLSDELSDMHKTQTGVLIGTPVYMSPEQCRGAGQVDHRSDIYSIACVMFRLLTGRTVFDGAGSGDVMASHLREPPPLAAALRPELPDMIDLILQRCLQKDPTRRFQSMLELADALGQAEQILHHSSQPTLAVEPSPPPITLTPLPDTPPPPSTITNASGQHLPPRTRSRWRWAVIAGAAFGAFAIMLGVGFYATRRHAQPEAAAAPRDASVTPTAVAPTPPPADAAAQVTPPTVDAGMMEPAAVAAPPTPHKPKPRHATSTAPASNMDVDRGD